MIVLSVEQACGVGLTLSLCALGLKRSLCRVGLVRSVEPALRVRSLSLSLSLSLFVVSPNVRLSMMHIFIFAMCDLGQLVHTLPN